MSIFICSKCNKEFKSQMALTGHSRVHGESNGKITVIFCSCLITHRVVKVSYLQKYQEKLKHCKHCNKPLSSNRDFCDHSCSATFNNLERIKNGVTTKHKVKQVKCLKCDNEFETSIHTGHVFQICSSCNPKSIKYKVKKEYCKLTKSIITIKEKVKPSPYSKIRSCTCSHCNTKFINRRQLKYCSKCSHLYSESNKLGYKFTFNVYHYPNLFDLKLLKEVGFFAPGGKSGRWNINGLSRDHKISVNDAIRNNYDSYYISHPLNCELMPHSQNNSKKTKSSITYEELVKLVNDFDNLLA